MSKTLMKKAFLCILMREVERTIMAARDTFTLQLHFSSMIFMIHGQEKTPGMVIHVNADVDGAHPLKGVIRWKSSSFVHMDKNLTFLGVRR